MGRTKVDKELQNQDEAVNIISCVCKAAALDSDLMKTPPPVLISCHCCAPVSKRTICLLYGSTALEKIDFQITFTLRRSKLPPHCKNLSSGRSRIVCSCLDPASCPISSCALQYYGAAVYSCRLERREAYRCQHHVSIIVEPSIK